MGMLGDFATGLSNQFEKVLPSTTSDRLERHAPLSRYGTTNPVDRALWIKDRFGEVKKKFAKDATHKPEHVLNTTVSHQRGAGVAK